MSNKAAVALGKLGGRAAWAKDREKMLVAVRANGRKGGRPKRKAAE